MLKLPATILRFPSHTEKHCGDILTAAAGSVESAANLLMDSAMAPSMSDADDSDVEVPFADAFAMPLRSLQPDEVDGDRSVTADAAVEHGCS